jgi:hypothetical protein
MEDATMPAAQAPSKPGRPQKAAHDQLSHVISFRVSPAELAKLNRRAAKAGQTNINAFARAAALGKPVTIRHESGPKINALAITALNRLGVNLNQITHHINAGRKPQIPYIEELIERIDSALDGLLSDDPPHP